MDDVDDEAGHVFPVGYVLQANSILDTILMPLANLIGVQLDDLGLVFV